MQQYNNLFPSTVRDDTVGIYKITNQCNGHCYIGQSKTVRARWRAHIYASQDENDAAYWYPLMCAFRKYGVENFVFELLEETTVSDLSAKEKFYIQLYDATSHNNYNQTDTIGGNCKEPAYVSQLYDDLIANQLSFQELAIKYNISISSVSEINGGRMWRNNAYTYPLRSVKNTNRRVFGKPILCIDKRTNTVVGRYTCSAEFAELHPEFDYHNVMSHINEVCKGKRLTAYGFKWKYDE